MYCSVFQEGLGTFEGFQAKIIDPNVQLIIFNKARTIPFSFRDKVKAELKWLQVEGTLEPLEIVN